MPIHLTRQYIGKETRKLCFSIQFYFRGWWLVTNFPRRLSKFTERNTNKSWGKKRNIDTIRLVLCRGWDYFEFNPKKLLKLSEVYRKINHCQDKIVELWLSGTQHFGFKNLNRSKEPMREKSKRYRRQEECYTRDHTLPKKPTKWRGKWYGLTCSFK